MSLLSRALGARQPSESRAPATKLGVCLSRILSLSRQWGGPLSSSIQLSGAVLLARVDRISPEDQRTVYPYLLGIAQLLVEACDESLSVEEYQARWPEEAPGNGTYAVGPDYV